MKRSTRVLLAAVVAWALLMRIGSAAWAGAVEPKVTTDRTMDTSSIESIVAALLQGKKTTQEKAIATFEFQRRMVYHVNSDGFGDHRDFMKSYNVYGCRASWLSSTTARTSMADLAARHVQLSCDRRAVFTTTAAY